MTSGSGRREATQRTVSPVDGSVYVERPLATDAQIAAVLEAAHWPVRVAEHPVGHGAREVYLDEAFAFWASQEGSTTK